MRIAWFLQNDKTRISTMDPKDAHTKQTADEHEKREKGLDRTLADSFPSSDPPSTIPDPISYEEVERDETTGQGIVEKADVAFRKTAQKYLDRAGIKLDLEHFENSIRQQPLIAAALAAAAGFVFGGGGIIRLGSTFLPSRGRKAAHYRMPKSLGSTILTKAR
jgi:hypothetical protein